jgi:hypothetical protein
MNQRPTLYTYTHIFGRLSVHYHVANMLQTCMKTFTQHARRAASADHCPDIFFSQMLSTILTVLIAAAATAQMAQCNVAGGGVQARAATISKATHTYTHTHCSDATRMSLPHRLAHRTHILSRGGVARRRPLGYERLPPAPGSRQQAAGYFRLPVARRALIRGTFLPARGRRPPRPQSVGR